MNKNEKDLSKKYGKAVKFGFAIPDVVWNMPIEELGLNPRCINALSNENAKFDKNLMGHNIRYTTVGDIVEHKSELSKIKNLGANSVKELLNRIIELSFSINSNLNVYTNAFAYNVASE